MLVYREQRFRAESRPLLDQLSTQLQRIQFSSSTGHDSVVDAFIAAGTLETAIADAIFTEADGVHPVIPTLRRMCLELGHALWHSWQDEASSAEHWCARALNSLGQVAQHCIPSQLEVTTPEGFAYYAVYPEAYLEAARRCQAELRLIHAVCIGLRSIGATLSAAVAAGLEESGCSVRSFTVRPRGHPYSRHLMLEPALEHQLLEEPDTHFLIIDEGPGISGSSLAGAAELLGRLGISDHRIVLMPSWKTDGGHLRSASARARWGRHPQFTVDFEELWVRSGKLGRAFPGWNWCDLSAGNWRQELYDDPEQYPAIQPQHERRKYLLRRSGHKRDVKWLSFAGLGGRAASILRRAEQLADAGFSPAPEGASHGFLLREFLPGTPVRAGAVHTELLETVAQYLSHLSCHHPAEPSIPASKLTEMAEINVAEGLGNSWLPHLGKRLPSAAECWIERSVALDGRMQAHEWIRMQGGYLKTDALDHHDDHFLPGCQDIAWDIAAAVYELKLDRSARHWLVERYRSISGDRTVADRLPRYAVCYLACRLGYTSLASSTLGSSPDGIRFASALDRYARRLREELSHSPGALWDV
jgi:hypothetical protein